jgi:hypothetical protein
MFGALKPRINQIKSHKNQFLLVPERQNLLIQTCRFSIPTIFWLSNLVAISRASGTITDRTLYISFHSSETVCKSTLKFEPWSKLKLRFKMENIHRRTGFIFGFWHLWQSQCQPSSLWLQEGFKKHSIVHQIVQMPQGQKQLLPQMHTLDYLL